MLLSSQPLHYHDCNIMVSRHRQLCCYLVPSTGILTTHLARGWSSRSGKVQVNDCITEPTSLYMNAWASFVCYFSLSLVKQTAFIILPGHPGNFFFFKFSSHFHCLRWFFTCALSLSIKLFTNFTLNSNSFSQPLS